ncbi:MAG: glycosyltransferase [bacterium]
MNRVLIVAYYTPPLGLSGVMRVTKLAKFLPEFGWEVLLLTVKDTAYYAYDPALLEDLKQAKVFRTESLDPNRLLRLFGVKKVREGVTETVKRLRTVANRIFFPDSKVGWLPFAVGTGKKVIERFQPKVIFASAPPWTSLLVGERLSRISGLPWVADFRDPWPEGFLEPASGQKVKLEKMRQRILQWANLTLAVNYGTARRVGASVEVLENGFDPDEMAAAPEPLDGFSILYAGNLWRQEERVRELLEALKAVPEARFYIAGGVDEKTGRMLAGSSQVQLLGVVSHRRILSLMKGAQVLLYLGKPGQPVGIKLYEYLGIGTPVVVWDEAGAESGEMVSATKRGLVCYNGAGFLACMREIKERRRCGQDDEWRGINLDRYNRRFQAKRLAGYFAGLLK